MKHLTVKVSNMFFQHFIIHFFADLLSLLFLHKSTGIWDSNFFLLFFYEVTNKATTIYLAIFDSLELKIRNDIIR